MIVGGENVCVLCVCVCVGEGVERGNVKGERSTITDGVELVLLCNRKSPSLVSDLHRPL